MDALRATVAHEIDKPSVVEGVNVVLNDRAGSMASQSQQDWMKAADFYFPSNVITRHEKASWFRR